MAYIETKLHIAVNKWRLSNVEKIYAFENRAVFRAISNCYGGVILKINHDMQCISSEYQMLRTISGNHSCKVYEFDDEHGMLLEERLLPGIVLRNEQDLDIRMKRFVEVFREIHFAPAGEYQYDTYLDWLDRACAKLQGIRKAEILAHEIIRARDLCRKLFQKYPERVLLHGDLHHDNLLLTADGSYSMIDPKGVVGPKVLDTPRFIMNELDPVMNKSGKEHIYQVMKGISHLLDYPVQDVSQLFYMEVMLGNAWCVEDGIAPDMDAVRLAMEIYNENEGR